MARFVKQFLLVNSGRGRPILACDWIWDDGHDNGFVASRSQKR